MEIREVKIEEYWPLIVKNTVEFGQIAAAENPEFNRLAKCIYQVLQESFVHDATEYGVKRWETILGINPASGATLDDRKATILTYLSVKVPYTWRVLKQMLVPILGGEDKFVMEYFNDEYKLVVHTDRLNDAMLATVSDLLERVLPQNIEVERYNHHIEVSWRDINKYAECVTAEDLYNVNPAVNQARGQEIHSNQSAMGWQFLDVCSDGSIPYSFDKLTDIDSEENGHNCFIGVYGILGFIERMELNLPALTRFYGHNNVKELILNAPNLLRIEETYASRLRHFKCNSQKIEIISNMAWTSPIESIECDFPKLRTGTFSNANGILNKESVLRICNTIPSWSSGSHPLKIGIHIDHQQDEEVLAAIANAEAKGWTLNVQWNGTPTSGISLMDLEEIWCKVTESEYGDYTDETGKRVSLDWGHYVTDTSEYKLFYSLVEAEQYFKLTRIENHE